ncbi:MAG: SpoIIE family protein phosphatase [Bacteroidales bacterium]|nr:SpoIIE family protein phosphatase [Bacteroidales bacterium]
MKQLVKYILFGVFVFVTFIFSSCKNEKNDAVLVDKGVLNLSDFNSNSIYSVHGNWEFYWDQLLTPQEIQNYPKDSIRYIKINNTWQEYEIEEGKKIGGHGFATFHVKILVPQGQYVLKVRQVISSYKIWIDGEPIDEIGKVGKSPEESIPKTIPREFFIESSSDTIDVVIQVSNFSHRLGGIQENVSFGSVEKVMTKVRGNLIYSYIIIGAEIIFAIFFLLTFFFRRQNPAYLFFSLAIIITLLFEIVNGEMLFMRLFPDISYWELTKKIDFIGNYGRAVFFILFIWYLFRDYKIINKYVYYVLLVSSIAGAIVVLVTPCRIYSYTLLPFMGLGLFLFFYINIVLLRGLLKKIPNIIYSFFGMTVFLIGMINDILFNLTIINTAYLLNTGLLIFFISHSVFLALNYSIAETKINTISNRFQILNRIRNELLKIPSFDLAEGVGIIGKEFNAEIAEFLVIRGSEGFCECKKTEAGVAFAKLEQNIVSDISPEVIQKSVNNSKNSVINFDGEYYLSMPLFLNGKIKSMFVIGKNSKFSAEQITIFEDLSSQIDVMYDNYYYYWNLENINKNLEGIIEKRTQLVYIQKDELVSKSAELDTKIDELKISAKKVEDLNEELVSRREEISVTNNTLEAQQHKITRHKNQLLQKKSDIDSSIRYAVNIHKTIFGRQLTISNADFFEVSIPKDIVSGDFWARYEFDDKIFISAIDSTGQNVTGTFLSFLILTTFEDVFSEINGNDSSPSLVLEKVRERYVKLLGMKNNERQIQDSFDISLIAYDKNKTTIEYSAARQTIVIIRKGDSIELDANNFSIGGYSEFFDEPFLLKKIDYKKGDVVYLFSDGFINQIDYKINHKLGLSNFIEILKKVSPLPFNKQADELKKLFINLKGTKKQVDDVLVVGVKFN